MTAIHVRPEDVGDADKICCDYGEYGVVFDGEAYFGFYWPSEYEYSEMGTFEQAQKWCLDSIALGRPVNRL